MADVFISYKSEDRAIAGKFAEALVSEGFDVWWDPILRTGETYDDVIQRNLRAAKTVVVLWSQRSVKSKWVRAEATIGERLGVLLPVLIERCERPLAFELTQTADLIGWNGDRADARWAQLVRDVRFSLESGKDLSRVPELPSDGDSEIEAIFWGAIAESDLTTDFETYLERYPNGAHAGEAREHLLGLKYTPWQEDDRVRVVSGSGLQGGQKNIDPKEARWWESWFAADYTWEGLAKRVTTNIDGSRQSLQDYWRIGDSGQLREDAEMAATGELVTMGETVYHICHLPRFAQGGKETWKADLNHSNWSKLDAILATKLAAAIEQAGPIAANWSGCVLRTLALNVPKKQDSPPSLELRLDRAIFLHRLDLSTSRLGASTFSGAYFVADTSFGACSFDSVSFDRCIFARDVVFSSAAFAGDVSFTEVIFEGDAFFEKATFGGVSRFDRAEFVSGADFRNAQFSAEAVFGGAAFRHDGLFDSASFTSNAEFFDVTFSSVARFEGVAFGDAANFQRTSFKETAYFDAVDFRGGMAFRAASFDAFALFERIRWPDAAIYWHGAFDQTLFKAAVSFAGSGRRSFASFDGAVLERGIRLDDAPYERQTFRRELDMALQAGRNDVSLAGKRGSKVNSVDRRLMRDMRLRELERGCRVLRLAAERQSDRNKEHSFYRYELILRRLQSATPVAERQILTVYALVSDYGLSIVRPLTSLIFVIVAVAAGLAGVARALDISTTSRQLAPTRGVAFAEHDFFEALNFSLSNSVVPLSGLVARPKDGLVGRIIANGPQMELLVRLLATFEGAIAILLFVLCALAIRRRMALY